MFWSETFTAKHEGVKAGEERSGDDEEGENVYSKWCKHSSYLDTLKFGLSEKIQMPKHY